ncbi:MAG TPA: hypothetical protein VLY63_06620 [Anaerolineae bacterium]|nr:hypothetical protein [Anaerolineae bacterium]
MKRIGLSLCAIVRRQVPTIRLAAGNPAKETAIDQRLGLEFMDTVLILYTLSAPNILIRPAARG